MATGFRNKNIYTKRFYIKQSEEIEWLFRHMIKNY